MKTTFQARVTFEKRTPPLLEVVDRLFMIKRIAQSLYLWIMTTAL